jgi:type I restriction enzyme S subunit
LPEYDNCPVPVQERIKMINEGIVPEGYKKTKVGIIPVEWDVKRIGKVKGIDLDPESLNNKTSNNYTFNYISLSDVAEGKLLNKTRICFQNAPSRAKKIVKKNDVLLSTVRPNLKSHLYIDWQESDLVCSTGFTVLRFDEKIINSLFIFLNCFSDNVDKQINSYLVGSNYPAITKKDVSALKIPIPFLTEQTAIANVLSTADKEIDLLNQKLETLKQQKKALMQLLLTGIVRTTGLKTN